MVKKATRNLDFSKSSGADCILVVVLKNCEPELSYMLAELPNMLKKVIISCRTHPTLAWQH